MTRFNEMIIRLAAWAEAYKDEKGQGMAEYGLILALIAVVVAAALGPLGDTIKSTIDEVAGAL